MGDPALVALQLWRCYPTNCLLPDISPGAEVPRFLGVTGSSVNRLAM